MLAAPLTFAGTARALEPFALKEVVLPEGDKQTIVPPDSLLDRGTETLWIRFTAPLNMTGTDKYLSIKDGSGAEALYTPGAADNMLYVTFRGPLRMSDTYTITVKGGPDGLKDRDGNTLARDVTFRFHTNARPMENTLTVGAMDEEKNPLQTNVYKITAKAGPLKLKAAAVPDALFQVVIMTDGPATLESGPAVLFNSFLNDKRTEATVNLPSDGKYVVLLTRVMADGKRGHGEAFQMTGPELASSNMYVPPILLREMEPGQVMTAPFDAQASILYNAPASYLKLKLDSTVLSNNLLRADGSAAPYTINPATLKEGLHKLAAIAQGPNSEHMGVAARLFVVDRVDSFADVPRSHWARTAVEVLADRGTLSGRGNGMFDPNAPVTREEFAKMLSLVLGLSAPDHGAPEFVDEPQGAWSRPYIQALAAEGLMKGENVGGANYAYPHRTITRAEAAAILGRSLGINDSWVLSGGAGFSDFSRVPDWAKPSVIFLSRMKWLGGFPDGTYGPSQSLTRAQAAKVLVKYLGL
jgi:hypothetical protein